MDPLQIFENFQLDTLDENWFSKVWDSEFLLFPEPPADYSIFLGSEDIEKLLKNTGTTVKQWIEFNKNLDETEEGQRPEVSWQTLVALNVNIKGLLAVLGYLIKAGQAMGADEDSRQACLAATSLYFILLSIPGSTTFHVFHPQLYHRAIETLKLSDHLVDVKKNRRAKNLEALYAEEPEDMLRQSEKLTLMKGLNSILFELITMLKTFYMKYQARSLEITIISLIEITKLETDVNHFLSKNKVIGASTTSLSYNAYVALHELCDSKHGNEEDTIRLIVKYLMPHLFPNYLDLSNKSSHIVWETIIHFLKNLLAAKKDSAELGIEILIQQLLVKCPERSDGRQKQAMVLSNLICICQEDLLLRCIKNLVKFSFHNKISYRIFAQEVIGKILSDLSRNNSSIEDTLKHKIKMILTATTLSRCLDSSNMVRGKSLSVIESICSDKTFEINDFANTAEENKSFASLEKLLNSIENFNNNPLPGANTINMMLLERIKDERALVRRSSMHCLQKLVQHFPNLLDEVTTVIGHHCRDPALTVRLNAIQVLSELLQKYPGSTIVLNEYVRSVLPRIFDVETKIQDKVLETLQNLVLNKINNLIEDTENQELDLPWKIINKLTEEKMKNNLSKSCEIWVKNGLVNKSLINGIQLHIGTKRNTEAWVLMASLAQHIELPNMKNYFEHIKDIFQRHDFVTSLMLEVLRYVWPQMDKNYLQILFTAIYENLFKYNISIETIGTCIDILNGISKHLYPETDAAYATELMDSTQALINQLNNEEDDISEDDISMYLKALSTLGHVSQSTSLKVSNSIINNLQALLLECDSFPNLLYTNDELKAASVVFLAQQALRDREIAQQVMPIFGRLMRQNDNSNSLKKAAIRVNAVKALADLCIRFTALVEPYLSDMCICMKDSNPLVREIIVVVFVQLLLEDYIKVKGAFFYHILTLVTDTDETIKDLTIFLIKERLLVKNKTLITQSFVKSIFHYNNCPMRHKFVERKLTKKERDTLTLPGLENGEKRKIIYDFLLENLDPPGKLKILTKLNSEILEGVSEEHIDINKEEGENLLTDVIYILTNDRLLPSFTNKSQEEDFQENENEPEKSISNSLSIILEGMKKFKVQIMLPTVLKLKNYIKVHKPIISDDVTRLLFKIISDLNKDQQTEVFEEHPKLKTDYEKYKRKNSKKSISDKMDVDEDDDANNEDLDLETSTNENQNNSKNKNDSSDEIHENFDENLQMPDITQLTTGSTPKKTVDLNKLQSTPKIVLRRLSSLTYSGRNILKSPSPENNNSSSSE